MMLRKGAPGWSLTFLLVIILAVLPGGSLAFGGEVCPLPLIAVIVDDLGYSAEVADQLAGMPMHMTWAIIPYQRHSVYTAAIARSRGIPFILHLPMEAHVDDGSRPLVRMGMKEEIIRLVVRNALWSMPGVEGLNNHRGSRATESRFIMESILKEVAAEGLFFVDSRTSADSVAYRTAVEMGVSATRNRRFLDNVDAEDHMWIQFEKALEIASKRGGTVVICHARPGTLRFLPKLYEKAFGDVKFVTVPEYLEQKRISGWEE